MIVTEGGRWGGFGLYLLKGKPVFNYNLLMLRQARWANDALPPLTPGKHTHRLRLQVRRPGHRQGRHRRADGRRQGGQHAVGSRARCRSCCPPTRPSTSVSTRARRVNDQDYQVPFRFNGTIDKVTFNLGPSQLAAAEQQAGERSGCQGEGLTRLPSRCSLELRPDMQRKIAAFSSGGRIRNRAGARARPGARGLLAARPADHRCGDGAGPVSRCCIACAGCGLLAARAAHHQRRAAAARAAALQRPDRALPRLRGRDSADGRRADLARRAAARSGGAVADLDGARNPPQERCRQPTDCRGIPCRPQPFSRWPS